MPRIEASLLDKFVNGAFAGKRKIGRPLKYNIRKKGAQGWIEIVFNPRNRVQQYMSDAIRFIHPYLCFITYRFHVEKAREAGKSPLTLILSLVSGEDSFLCVERSSKGGSHEAVAESGQAWLSVVLSRSASKV